MVLSLIQSSSDLKKLSLQDLQKLANEIRELIISTLSKNGGHLASNLGVVELTIALHAIFNSPQDKLIYDVSHQCYAHKLLTGRKERFHTLREWKGLSGFASPEESPHDPFFGGHAATALSLSLGLAKNRDMTGRDEYIVPIIGDGILTCGLSLEALNNIPKQLKKFIVILNDNAMSISKNVGAISRILSRFLSNPTAHRLYQDLDTTLSKIPSFGPLLAKQSHKITESLKNLVSPAVFFEQYGLSYIGPVDGHNIKELMEILEELKRSNGPILLHVITKKGKGMEEATQNPEGYHGVKPFDIETGKFIETEVSRLTFPKIFGKLVLNRLENDPAFLVLTPAMAAGSGLLECMRKFPDRCLDVGIAESHAVTFSGGASFGSKMRVLVSIYSTFLQRAFDNLFHDVCLQKHPVVFAIDRAGLSGPDGVTHHGIYDLSFLTAMPNMIIAQPRDGKVLKELFDSAFTWGRPSAIRYPNMITEEGEAPFQQRIPGEAELLKDGDDLLIIALGTMNKVALEVAEKLKEKGISAAVLDPVFVKPLDTDLLCRLLLTHERLVTIEEHALTCGFGAYLNHYLLSSGYNGLQVLNLGLPDAFLPHGSYKDLMKEFALDSESVVKSILHHFNFKTQSTLMEALNSEEQIPKKVKT